jgi:hypothetical protein
VDVISEEEAFPFMSLVSEIGGDLSLFIGITILSFVEFAEFLIRLLCSCIASKK